MAAARAKILRMVGADGKGSVNIMRWRPHFLLWQSAASIFLAAQAAAGPSLAITDVTVIDTVRGERIGPRTVLIRDGRIAAIDQPGATRIPGRGDSSGRTRPLSHAGSRRHARPSFQ